MTKLAGVYTILQYAVLLWAGPYPAVFVAAGTALATALADRDTQPLARLLQTFGAHVGSVAAAAAAFALVAPLVGEAWPARAIPVAFAVITHAAVISATRFFLTTAVREPVASYVDEFASTLQHAVIAATIAAGVATLVEQQWWSMLALASLPIFCLYSVYVDYLTRLEADAQQAALGDGLARVDAEGRVTFVSEPVIRMLECPRERLLGQVLTSAVACLRNSKLPNALSAATGSAKTAAVVDVSIGAAASTRDFEVRIQPSAQGATLLWQDVTARRREERAQRRQEQRLALAAEGADEGLWEWDLASKEFYASARWKASLGLAADVPVKGPEDWLGRVHADDLAALKEAVAAHLAGHSEYLRHEHRLLHADGSYRWFCCHAIAARSSSGRSVRIAGSLRDTTEWVHAQERLRSAGFLDPLTGLLNRALFLEALGRRLDESKQRLGGRFGLLYLDLDRFKVVNDSLGHLVGDELLVAVARRLESCVRPGDSLARLGGDEFAILITHLGEDQQANAMAFRIQEALRAPLSISGREVFTSASIGIALGPAQYSEPDEIMRDADTAMYHAKSRGKATHEVFDADMHARVRDRLGLESDLRHAVSGNDFEVHYQPIVLLASGMCVGFEALVRWRRNGELVSPATFIPMAEELGLIEPIGTWVLQEACTTFADWQRRHRDAGLDYITVNVSSRQLMQHNFLRIVERAVLSSGLNPNELRLEITETALMDSPAVASESLRELRELGVKIYLDDFGTGYSSLSHLHKLPVDALKIDRSFVKSLMLPDRPAIVESVLALARTLNTSVVAEGIESERQARELERLGCTHAQGFLFSKPLATSAAEALICAARPLGPKGAPPVVLTDSDVGTPTGAFEWPAHVALR